MADLSHIEISSDEEMSVQVPIVGSQRYTWFPSDDNWLVTSPDANALDEVTAHEQAAFAAYLSQAVPLPTPFGLDAPPISTRFGDVRRLGDQALPEYPPITGTRVDIPLPAICDILLKHRVLFERNDTIYLVVDSRAPHNVSHWPAFCAWWSSRRNLVGPYQEATDLCYIIADSDSGLSNIPFYQRSAVSGEVCSLGATMTMPALSSKCCSVTKIMPGALGTPPCNNV